MSYPVYKIKQFCRICLGFPYKTVAAGTLGHRGIGQKKYPDSVSGRPCP